MVPLFLCVASLSLLLLCSTSLVLGQETIYAPMPACPSDVRDSLRGLYFRDDGTHYDVSITTLPACKHFCLTFPASENIVYYDLWDRGCDCYSTADLEATKNGNGDVPYRTAGYSSDNVTIYGCLGISSANDTNILLSTGAGGDPHLVGARGEVFDFNGDLGKSFCLFTDKALHVNILLDGYYNDQGSLKTWIKAMAFLWRDMSGKEHSVQLVARKGKEQSRGHDGFLESINADGVPVISPKMSGDAVESDGGFHLLLKKHNDNLPAGIQREVYLLNIDNVLEAEFHLKPELVGLQSSVDAQVHFDLKVTKIQTTPEVHGILGQTYRTGVSRVVRALEYSLLSKLLGSPVHADGKSGAGLLDGVADDYQTTGLTSADCKFAKAWMA